LNIIFLGFAQLILVRIIIDDIEKKLEKMKKEIHESEEKFQEINCSECKTLNKCIIYPCANLVNLANCVSCFLNKKSTNLNDIRCFRCMKAFKNPEIIKEWIKNSISNSLNNQKLEKCKECKNDFTFSIINCCQASKSRCAPCISKSYKFAKHCPFCEADLDTKRRKEIEYSCKVEGIINPNLINLSEIIIQKESKCFLCSEKKSCIKVNCCIDSDNLICFLCFKRKFLLGKNNLKCPFCICKINYGEKYIENWRNFDYPLQGKESLKYNDNINLPDEKKLL